MLINLNDKKLLVSVRYLLALKITSVYINIITPCYEMNNEF